LALIAIRMALVICDFGALQDGQWNLQCKKKRVHRRRAEPLRDKLLFDMGVRAAPLRHAKRAIVGLFQGR
jgi:hypothetical protein